MPNRDAIDKLAAVEAKKITASVVANADKPEIIARDLNELRFTLVKEAVDIDPENCEAIVNRPEFVWNLANLLPEFDISAGRSTRASALSLAACVLVGWLLGGLLSGLLNIFSLGGDILRAAAIFCALWLGEYFSANARARKTALTLLGFGGLARFASSLASGAIRLTGLGGLSRAVFGAARPNIFKAAWLLLGALFLLIFFSRKTEIANPGALEESLRVRIARTLRLILFVCDAVNQRDAELRKLKTSEEDERHNRSGRLLAEAALSLADTLDGDRRAYFREKMREAGVVPTEDNDDDFIVWNDKSGELYQTAGLVRDGDKCRVLRRPTMEKGKLVKGFVQKAPPRNISK